MVTRSDERTPAISTVREKQSRECSNCAMRRRIPSSIISRTISIFRCKRLRPGWQQLRVKRTKRLTCCGVRRMPKTFWANIQFHPERLFPFANNSAVSSSKWGNQKKRSRNLKLRSRSIQDDSEDYMERRELPSKTETRKMRTVITPSWRRNRQKPLAHDMNWITSANSLPRKLKQAVR